MLICSATTHRIGCLIAFSVASFRVRALATEMGLLVPARPAVVPGLGTISRSKRAGTKLRSELHVGQECPDQLGVNKGKFFR